MRLLFKIIGLLLVVAVVVVIVVASNLGGLVKKAVETYAPPVLGTSVLLDSATLMPWSGSGALNGLQIAQPSGYGEGDVIALNKAAVGVDLKSLSADPIVVTRIIVDGPQLNYVQTADGNNIQTLLRNVQSHAGGSSVGGEGSEAGSETAPRESTSSDKKSDKPAKKIIIDLLSISNVSVSASSPLLPGQSVGLTLKPIELRDIGRAEGGLNADQIAAIVTKRLNAEVQKSVADSDEFKALLEDTARTKAREEVDRTLERELGGDKAGHVKGFLDKL